jgi:hypothetical protein
MMTSDGISSRDWDEVEKLSFSIADAIENESDSAVLVEELFNKLDRLESKYGKLPSITATRADYIDCPSKQLSLLKEAYASSLEINDKKNMAYISASIAEFYMENDVCPNKVQFWASVFLAYIETLSKNDEYLSFVRDEVNQYLISK